MCFCLRLTYIVLGSTCDLIIKKLVDIKVDVIVKFVVYASAKVKLNFKWIWM